MKQKIIAAAGKLFAKEGFDATSMAQIASKVGIEKASLYYHFKDKDAIFAAVMENIWRGLSQDLDAFCTNPKIIKKHPREILTHILVHIVNTSLKSGMAMVKLDQSHKDLHCHYQNALVYINDMREKLLDFLKTNKVKQPKIAGDIIINAVYGYVVHAQHNTDQSNVKVYSQYLASLFL